jgi:hypothetical protein
MSLFLYGVNSVELIANKNIVPLQTIAPQPSNQIPQRNDDDEAVKGQVKFSNMCWSYDEMNILPRMIEFEAMGHGENEEWSTVSGSAVKGRWQRSVGHGEPMQPIEEQSKQINKKLLL